MQEDVLTNFGASDIPLSQKQGKVDGVFTSVASQYDLMNDLMSVGLHRVWKRALVQAANPPRVGRFQHLDVAGGTGDITLAILKAASAEAHTTLLDINAEMLDVGRKRIETTVYKDQVTILQGNAECLALPDQQFDLYTIAFGIRNVPQIQLALNEAYRVLKPGGHFLCLEFSHVDMPLFSDIYNLYSDHVIPRLGQMVAGDSDSYKYLVESIRRFPRQDQFASMIKEAGFSNVTYRGLTGNIATIHSGWRI